MQPSYKDTVSYLLQNSDAMLCDCQLNLQGAATVLSFARDVLMNCALAHFPTLYEYIIYF
jgi:hypothetical protein